MKHYFSLIVFFIVNTNIFAQSQLEEQYFSYDYFSHSYKYLDKDYNIRISNDKFQSLVVEYKFYPDRIVNYKDSLSVVLCGEFENWKQIYVAEARLGFTWLRASYYLWISEKEAEKLGHSYNFKHPYKLYEYCYIDSDNNWDDDMKDFFNDLRAKVQIYTGNVDVWELSTKSFLDYSMVQNPVRQKDFELWKKEKSKANSCTSENCCQHKDSNKELCDSVKISN